ncbi:MAG: hypothetical protein JRJ54_14220 [Deltaproteobacteria bacterium]|nr:hypothetical protein [Deltaproteobacteria bacterium]
MKPFGFHALRRHVASILADRHTVSSKTVQRFLRHKSVYTTELYIQNINMDLRSVASLLNESTLNRTPNGKEVNRDIG